MSCVMWAYCTYVCSCVMCCSNKVLEGCFHEEQVPLGSMCLLPKQCAFYLRSYLLCVMKEHGFDCYQFPSFQMCEIGQFELLFVLLHTIMCSRDVLCTLLRCVVLLCCSLSLAAWSGRHCWTELTSFLWQWIGHGCQHCRLRKRYIYIYRECKYIHCHSIYGRWVTTVNHSIRF